MADSKQRILITGMAGFIGYHLAKKLGREGFDVYGVDKHKRLLQQPNLKKTVSKGSWGSRWPNG